MAGGGASGEGMAEDEYAAVKTAVWWDIENCQVPRTCDAHLIAQNISSALAAAGYRGPVTISAFGDTSNIPSAVQQALNSTGITLNHVPAGVKDASDKKILVDMLFWAVDNRPPANYLLISGDRDFSNALHQLRLRRYNIILAQPPNVSQALVAAAKIVWNWKDLVAGGQPLQEPPYSNNTSSGTSQSEATLNGSTADTVQTTQRSGPAAAVHLGNQKTFGNGKVDHRYKAKNRKCPNPSQAIIDMTTMSSNEIKQPPQVSRSFIADTSVPQLNNSRKNPDQMSIPTISNTKVQETSHLNHTASYFPLSTTQQPPSEASYSYQPEAMLFKEAPHEFFRGNRPHSSSGPVADYATPRSNFPVKDRKDFSDNHKSHWPQPLRPSDLLPSQHSIRPGNLSSSNSQNYNFYVTPTPTPNGPNGPPFTTPEGWTSGSPFLSAAPVNLPEIAGVTISGYSGGDHHNSSSFKKNPKPNMSYVPEHNGPHNLQTFYQEQMHGPPTAPAMNSNMSKDGLWNYPGSLMPPTEVQINIILQALQILKADKMVPNEANIADCIRYGEMNIPSFNIKVALGHAMKHQLVVMHKLGSNLPYYVKKNDAMWRCLNPMDANAKHPKATLDAVLKFLSSTNGRSSIMTTQCRYQAAIILRNSCLNNLVLGEILQILHVIISVKKWITPYLSGWQPLSFHLPDSDKMTDGVGSIKY